MDIRRIIYTLTAVPPYTFFNRELLGGLIELDRPIKIQAGEKLNHLSQIGSLYKALWHLPLPVSTYHYSENAILDLLSFVKLADDHYIICNTRANNVIYMQSKDNGKYLQFQRDPKFNLYYINISEANVEYHCYFSTVKKGKSLFSILDQKERKQSERYKNVMLSHPTKTLSMHWSATPLKG